MTPALAMSLAEATFHGSKWLFAVQCEMCEEHSEWNSDSGLAVLWNMQHSLKHQGTGGMGYDFTMYQVEIKHGVRVSVASGS